jgi:phage host-nuclease inhibitor protein Gam
MKDRNGFALKVDALLAEMVNARHALARSEAQADLELTQAREEWRRRLAPLQERVAELDKAILQGAKTHRAELFDGRDRVDLPHGALLHSWQESVKRSRGVLAELKALGFDDAVRVVETVKWEVLEDWPEEKLVSVGTERVRKETFAYEVKDN